MKRYSPTLEGFRAIFRLPSLGLAEIAWRWSFGLATVALLALSFREYLSTLPVTATEMLMLQTRQPSLVMQAITRILQGSGPRAVATLIVLALALTLAWIVLASLGRGATLKALFEDFQEGDQSALPTWRFASLMGLNFLRAGVLLAVLIGVVGAILLAGAASSKTNPSPGIGLLIFLMLMTFIGLAWSTLNSFLSLAAIFVVGKQETALGALAATVDLFRSRPGAVAAVNIWFGIDEQAARPGHLDGRRRLSPADQERQDRGRAPRLRRHGRDAQARQPCRGGAAEGRLRRRARGARAGFPAARRLARHCGLSPAGRGQPAAPARAAPRRAAASGRGRGAVKGGVHTAQRHDSALKHVTGQAVYIDDMPEPAGTLHAALVLSPSRTAG